MTRALCFGLAVLVASCAQHHGGDGGTDGGGGAAPTLEVGLSSAKIHWIDGVANDAPTVTATLIAADGTRTDVTGQAVFTIDPSPIGAMTGTTLMPTGTLAGHGAVNALYNSSVSGSASFEVFVAKTTAGTAPAGTADLFAAATLDSSAALALAYPPANAMVPPNLGQMEVHWRDPSAKNLYQVTLTGGYVTLTSYVTGLGTATYDVLAADDWALLSSGSSGLDLNIRVRGLASASPATYLEGSEGIRIAAEAIVGGVYYWDTSKTAIFRFDMSTPQVPPSQFYPAVGQTACVGCHAIARDGTVVAYRQDGGTVNYGNALKVSGLTREVTPNTVQWNYAAVHPNDTDLFTTSTSGLYRTDLTTSVTTPLYTAARISAPDVSVDGNHIVAAQMLGGDEVYMTASKLVVLDYDTAAKTVAAPRTLVTPTGSAFVYYPSYSPDDQWVLYNQATGGNAYNNRNAELWVTKADGTGMPIRLSEAEVAAQFNSWPKWTPFVTHEPTMTSSETVIWYTFASQRPFGVRSPGAQKPQLWLAPFYPDRAAAGQPATGPAVRLPFQDLAEGNHTAQWTQQIISVF
jgi:hypothetical protein